ncbi:hypothetical protein E3P92_03808 [Wallemia ichthyophaga]|uniref:Dihydrofolate reductase n=1 Tax=Wallemia ichthyophaga TaxID=245174 RepID=A0A4T0J822_WALIC|nr:hypothetical protein E3P95_03827 [Wallemia ichthyophaga]TIA96121.1 hypothetical protein E3P94_03822 [Wallemia ichthyophaga]TIB07697.1 hypothetical protein E3P93_03764 [Wallemia ichthyophaga]TIB08194.1 hypothetical protein E3P90_03774 [Wallemia ichthyophaga]TIB08303.1 hypothetical protein E3P92_03808 [Wallemia ichthyophaga]
MSSVTKAGMQRISNLNIIVAATNSNGIGVSSSNSLPWKLSNELKFFAKVTSTKPAKQDESNLILMGRKVWDSIPNKFKPLRNRLNVVLSRNHTLQIDDKVKLLSSVESALNLTSHSDSRVFCIGGAQIYNKMIPYASRLFITRIKQPSFEQADVKFSDFSDQEWRRCTHEDFEAYVGFEVQRGDIEENGVVYEFQMYERR